MQSGPLSSETFLFILCMKRTFACICVRKTWGWGQRANSKHLQRGSTTSFSRHMSSNSVWHSWPWENGTGEPEERQQQKDRPQWNCGYFCELPGVRVCPRNDGGLKNVVGAALFMQSTGSWRGDGEYGENSLARVSLSMTWKSVTQIPITEYKI